MMGQTVSSVQNKVMAYTRKVILQLNDREDKKGRQNVRISGEPTALLIISRWASILGL